MERDLIKKTANSIVNSSKIVALTGAGISVESGIAPFRGKNGLWEKYDPEEYGHIESFRKNPYKSWRMLEEMADEISEAEPNSAHLGLAKLEKIGKLEAVITQNVDNLHQEAGNKYVVEFHGNYKCLKCIECNKKHQLDEYEIKEIPPKCSCGGVLKPDVVFFGETIPQEPLKKSAQLSSSCDIMLIIGTSAVVYPAANIPIAAKRNNAKVVEINPESTPLTATVSDYVIKGKAGEIVPRIVQEVEEILGEEKVE